MVHCSVRAGPTVAALTMALLLCFGSANAGNSGAKVVDPLSDDLVPRPELSPAEVIRIQLEALRNNDERDRGIEVAFRFASPANRASTGPLPRFIRMIEDGPYSLMLEFRKASYGAVEVRAERARQRVTLTGARARISYWFHLSRQSEAPCAGCWMTDAVSIERTDTRAAWLAAGRPMRVSFGLGDESEFRNHWSVRAGNPRPPDLTSGAGGSRPGDPVPAPFRPDAGRPHSWPEPVAGRSERPGSG